MRETRFIDQMKGKWKEFEHILKSPTKSPERLYHLFINILDDLSFARTYYPNRSVRVYLNGVAQQIFFTVYRKRKSNARKLFSFWTNDMPRVLFDARQELLISFLVFAVSVAIGIISCAMDDTFLEVILGEQYVQMTLENIASGDPMAVYKQKGELSMSLGIAFNNLIVAFLTFVMGIFYTLGSLLILISNGIMLGAFQFFFVKENLFWESFLTIWIHGTLEISAIIIAGAAGIAMGKGFVFPGTYSRLKSFQRSARRGLKIMLGIAPIIVLAAFFEGFLTRYTETSDVLRGLFIFVCLAFVILYVVVYPIIYVKRNGLTPIESDKLIVDKDLEINWRAIKTNGNIIGDTFVLFRKNFWSCLVVAFACAGLYTVSAFFISEDFSEQFLFYEGLFSTLRQLPQFFANDTLAMALVVCLPLSMLLYLTFTGVHTIKQPHWLVILKLSIIVVLFDIIVVYTGSFNVLLLLVLLPILLLWTAVCYYEDGSVYHTFRRTLELLKKQYFNALGLFAVLMLIGFIFFNLLDTIVVELFFEKLAWLLPFEEEVLMKIGTAILVFITMTTLYIVFILTILAQIPLYFSYLEASEANYLVEGIEKIGNTRRIRGIEQENAVTST